eukprot:CAMPEP_0194334926 /NCGR_PEP_ID=MMETSP0171-20130528/67769_1 /TAXON_ID=218684 /ORGANISM="Corethron pennatum, Strain L29A3" /LENGTH=238 /DNA_ID=CAMNT_0039097783 /DNA_START=131 /DNA_END=847 /DNA_ORIENTATION=-
MRADQYGDLARKIVEGTRTFLAVVDFNPFSVVKYDPKKFAAAVQSVLADVDADAAALVSPDRRVVVGGHSAGGHAAAAACAADPGSYDGFVGLDPCPLPGSGFEPIPLPTFVWGFRKKTCGVDPAAASEGAYAAAGHGHRTLVVLDNGSGGGRAADEDSRVNHCVFADGGCGVACPGGADAAGDRVRRCIADALRVFLKTLGGTNSRQEIYRNAAGNRGDPVEVYVDEEEVPIVGRVK